MIGTNSQWDSFISNHRWAVLTSLRASGQPNSSVVAYARHDDQLVISTPGATFKTGSIARDPRVSLTILSNAEPFNFVSVEADAVVTKDRLLEDTRKVFAAIEGTGFDEPPDLAGWLDAQQRVILRLNPTRVYGVIR